MKTNKELLLEVQQEQNQIVATCRVNLFNALVELEGIGGKDNYKASLLAIVNATGGVELTPVRAVLPDAVELGKAVTALKNTGEILVDGNGRGTHLTAVKPPVIAPAVQVLPVQSTPNTPVEDAQWEVVQPASTPNPGIQSPVQMIHPQPINPIINR